MFLTTMMNKNKERGGGSRKTFVTLQNQIRKQLSWLKHRTTDHHTTN